MGTVWGTYLQTTRLDFWLLEIYPYPLRVLPALPSLVKSHLSLKDRTFLSGQKPGVLWSERSQKLETNHKYGRVALGGQPGAG